MEPVTVLQAVHQGILVEVLKEGARITHPGLYKHVLTSGGICAMRLVGANISGQGIEYSDQQIVLIDSIVGQLTVTEQEAVLAHEAAHIKLNHMAGETSEDKMETLNILEDELAADLAGVRATSATVMLSALNKLSVLTAMTLTGIKKPKIGWFVAVVCRTKVMRKRVRALKTMIKAGL